MAVVDKPSAREAKRLQTKERLMGSAIAEFKRSGMADADVERNLQRVVSDVRRIVAGSARAWNSCHVERIVQPAHVLDRQREGVEKFFARSDL